MKTTVALVPCPPKTIPSLEAGVLGQFYKTANETVVMCVGDVPSSSTRAGNRYVQYIVVRPNQYSSQKAGRIARLGEPSLPLTLLPAGTAVTFTQE